MPAIRLAFFISRKGCLILADDKKNIGSEVETYRADITKTGESFNDSPVVRVTGFEPAA